MTHVTGVSIVILVHNQLRFTEFCLPHLFRIDTPTEIIVVNNGSSDDTATFLDGWSRQAPSHFSIRLLQHEANVGGSSARNRAAEVARGDVIIFMDNDVFGTERNWARALAVALSDPSIGSVGPLLLYPQAGAPIIQSAGGGISSQGHFGLLCRGRPLSEVYFDKDQLRAWMPAATLACRRSDFLRVGGFDEALDPLSIGEDIDLCFKLWQDGLKCVLFPQYELRHFEGTTFNALAIASRKKEFFIRNSRIIRARWSKILPLIPISTDEELRYCLVQKDYRSVDAPRIRVNLTIAGSIADPNDGEWSQAIFHQQR